MDARLTVPFVTPLLYAVCTANKNSAAEATLSLTRKRRIILPVFS